MKQSHFTSPRASATRCRACVQLNALHRGCLQTVKHPDEGLWNQRKVCCRLLPLILRCAIPVTLKRGGLERQTGWPGPATGLLVT